MDRLEGIKIFVRVVESGSFSAVARELGTGQPAISKQIAALEERLGAQLLMRTSRSHLICLRSGLICVDRQPIPTCFPIARGAPVRGWLGRMPFVAIVAGRHERFSAQASSTGTRLDSLSVTTSCRAEWWGGDHFSLPTGRASCPLYPQKRTSAERIGMSA
jgi:Bacterial regulatory helix-turn-helix protein, lysR family